MLFQREETTTRGSGKQSKTLPQLDRQEIKIPTHHDCFGWVASTYIHKDIIILVKVDACRIVGKNGVLFFWWWRGYIVDLGPYKREGKGKKKKKWFFRFARNGHLSISRTKGVRNYKPAVLTSFSSSSFCEPN